MVRSSVHFVSKIYKKTKMQRSVEIMYYYYAIFISPKPLKFIIALFHWVIYLLCNSDSVICTLSSLWSGRSIMPTIERTMERDREREESKLNFGASVEFTNILCSTNGMNWQFRDAGDFGSYGNEALSAFTLRRCDPIKWMRKSAV